MPSFNNRDTKTIDTSAETFFYFARDVPISKADGSKKIKLKSKSSSKCENNVCMVYEKRSKNRCTFKPSKQLVKQVVLEFSLCEVKNTPN